MNGIAIIRREGEFNRKGGGFGDVSCKDDDSVWGFGILIGNSEMEMHVRFAIEHGYCAVTGNDLKRTFEVKRRFALLAVEVKGTEFYFTESAEEFEGGGLDSMFFGDFDEGGVDIRVISQRAHEDAGAGSINLLDGCGHKNLLPLRHGDTEFFNFSVTR